MECMDPTDATGQTDTLARPARRVRRVIPARLARLGLWGLRVRRESRASRATRETSGPLDPRAKRATRETHPRRGARRGPAVKTAGPALGSSVPTVFRAEMVCLVWWVRLGRGERGEEMEPSASRVSLGGTDTRACLACRDKRELLGRQVPSGAMAIQAGTEHREGMARTERTESKALRATLAPGQPGEMVCPAEMDAMEQQGRMARMACPQLLTGTRRRSTLAEATLA